MPRIGTISLWVYLNEVHRLSAFKKYALRATATVAAIVSSLLAVSPCVKPHSAAHRTERSSNASRRYFTVRDSIEMSRFERGGKPIFSPDGKYFAVVTSRGIIDSDEIESTLRVFKAEDVEKLLKNSDGVEHLRATIIARLAAVPKVDYVNSYAPIISNVKWADSSKTLLFLGQNAHKERQLYRASLVQASPRVVTRRGYDVSQFDSHGRTIAYRAAQTGQSLEIGKPINADAREINGVPLVSLLFGERAQRYPPYSELWMYRNGRNLRITDPSSKRPVRLSNSPVVYPGLNPLSVSPDGHLVVALVAASSIPESWESYMPAVPSLKLRSTDPGQIEDSNWERPTEYVLVDLNSGNVKPLLSAPHGWALGYPDKNLAVWSSNGKKVLLTNTFLRLDGVDEQERLRRLRPCAAVVVDIASETSSCVTFSAGTSSPLFAASFGTRANEVELRFGRDSVGERYSGVNGGTWQRIPSTNAQQPPGSSKSLVMEIDGLTSLSVAIRQDLNTPPALWATDQGTRRSTKIWDPNPHLREFTLGEVSVFHWKDKTGHEWTGGLVKPPDYVSGKRYPLVIQTHGFIADEFMSDGQFTTAFAARPLAAAGMIVLQVPDRSDHIETPNEAPDNILGFEAAIESLSSEGAIDPHKVGIIGFSRSSYYVESALIQNPECFAAASIAEGVDESYLQGILFGTTKPGGRGEGEAIYGGKPFGEGLYLWLERAPGFHLDRIQVPLRIEADSPGGLLGEWETYASLSRQGKPVDLIYIADGQHILQKPLERMASQEGNVDWFRFWLKGEEDPALSKVPQYARWKELRNRNVSRNAYP